ncbi:hypothetical protein AQJ84_09935 [Streptomyces resistomycificus]|nr:hypothetical protein AQJ84_09935 [Streptomyces resistomycificus]
MCAAGALLAGIGGARCADGPHWVPAATLLLTALGLAAAAAREARAHSRVVEAHRLARQAALGVRPRWSPPRPCCDFWRGFEGADHHPDCVRADGTAAQVARAWRELHTACCLRGWESRGAVHDPEACAVRAAA